MPEQMREPLGWRRAPERVTAICAGTALAGAMRTVLMTVPRPCQPREGPRRRGRSFDMCGFCVVYWQLYIIALRHGGAVRWRGSAADARPICATSTSRAFFVQVNYFRVARDSGIGCLLRMRASFPDKLMQTKRSQSRPALTQNLCAKKHSVTVHAAFHSSLRPRDGKQEYAVALGFDIMRNVVIERKQPSGLHLNDLFLGVNLDLTRE